MADNIYIFEDHIDQPATADDGTGIDTIIITGTYLTQFGHVGAQLYMFYENPFRTQVLFNTYAGGMTIQHYGIFDGQIENAIGGPGNEDFHGGSAANYLQGDPLDVAGSADFMDSREGNDTLVGAGGSDGLYGGLDNDLLFGDIDPFGQDQGNYVQGDDTVHGDQGNDTVYGGFGTNVLSGDEGYDTVDYSGFFDDFGNTAYRIVSNLQAGTVVVYAKDLYDGTETIVASDSVSGFEVIRGTGGNDSMSAQLTFAPGDFAGSELHGGAGRDTLAGGPGLDALYGGDGDDVLMDFSAPPPGGGGVDVMSGGGGGDYYTITNATTLIVEAAGNGFDYVMSMVSYTLPANVEKLSLAPYPGQPLNGTGNAGDNFFEGNDAANDLGGLGGNDYAMGFGGNDTLRGDNGGDTLYGGTGNDQVLGANKDDLLYGDAGVDALYGGTENDRLYGGAQADFLQGGLGRDVLRGGTGADTFYFASAAETVGAGRDLIEDFTSGQDLIDLHRIAKGQVFIGAAGFSGTGSKEVRYDAAQGTLMGDSDGNGVADYQISLRIGTLLVGTDLIL